MGDAPNFHKKLTESGKITAHKNTVLDTILVGTDDLNDPEITVFDGQDDSGTECVPTATQPADKKGWFGLIKYNCLCLDGIYVKIGGNGTVEVVGLWRFAGSQL
jgi:hypothetical protein